MKIPFFFKRDKYAPMWSIEQLDKPISKRFNDSAFNRMLRALKNEERLSNTTSKGVSTTATRSNMHYSSVNKLKNILNNSYKPRIVYTNTPNCYSSGATHGILWVDDLLTEALFSIDDDYTILDGDLTVI